MLWVYGHDKYFFHSHSAGIDFRRENLTSVDIRFQQTVDPALQGLSIVYNKIQMFFCEKHPNYWNYERNKICINFPPVFAKNCITLTSHMQWYAS